MRRLAGIVATVLISLELVPSVAQEAGDVLILDEDARADAETPLGIVGSEQRFAVEFEKQRVEIPWMANSEGDVVVQGDIIVGKFAELDLSPEGPQLQSLDDLGLQGLFAIGNYLWPKGVVPYEINIGADQPQYAAIDRAISAWERASKIQFVAKTANTPNYISFVAALGPHCSSSVGMRGGRQFLKLGESCKAGNIAHEIGHALGLAHEQMRQDRNTFVRFFPENVMDGYEGQFGIFPKRFEEEGEYCYRSLMHYHETAFSTDPTTLKTLEARDGSEIGQRKYISECDRSVIDDVYSAEYAKRNN